MLTKKEIIIGELMSDPMKNKNYTDVELRAYRHQVSTIMEHRYGVSWDDVDGTQEALINALLSGQSAEDFVTWFGEKYDLISIEEL